MQLLEREPRRQRRSDKPICRSPVSPGARNSTIKCHQGRRPESGRSPCPASGSQVKTQAPRGKESVQATPWVAMEPSRCHLSAVFIGMLTASCLIPTHRRWEGPLETPQPKRVVAGMKRDTHLPAGKGRDEVIKDAQEAEQAESNAGNLNGHLALSS